MGGRLKQDKNEHHSKANQSHDLRGKYVLVSDWFVSFGSHGRHVPVELLREGPGHRKFDLAQETVATNFLTDLESNNKFRIRTFVNPLSRGTKQKHHYKCE
jgi:hypothetical protein